MKLTNRIALILFISVFLLNTKIFVAQKIEHSMKNYSYHIIGLIGTKPEIGGTGLFIKKDLKYYFVTAWHCFSFRNYITKEFGNPNAPLIKDIIIYRNITDVKSDNYLIVNLENNDLENANYLSIYNDGKLLDISAIEIDRESVFDFDYIDLTNINLQQENIPIGTKAFYYGYPVVNGAQTDSSQYFEGSITEVGIDISEYTIKITGYIGCSGAPLFINSNGNNHLRGILFYALIDESGKANYCKAIDIKYLIEKL